MQYILLLYAREAGWAELTQAQQEQAMGAYNAYTALSRKARCCRAESSPECESFS